MDPGSVSRAGSSSVTFMWLASEGSVIHRGMVRWLDRTPDERLTSAAGNRFRELRTKPRASQITMKHSSLWEGTRLGLVVATTIWLWLAGIDAVVGQPFRTFAVLGGIAQFTLLHYGLNVAYGIAIVWAIHRAAREPSLVMGVAFGFFIVEFGFAMLTVLLSHLGLGRLARSEERRVGKECRSRWSPY